MPPAPKASEPPPHELLRLIFESVRDYAIFSMNSDGLVTSWNAGAEKLLGWSGSEILGSSADVIFTPGDRAAGIPQQERLESATTGRASDDRWQQRKNGERFWASGLMMRLENPEQGFVKILRDHTDKHLAEERLRQSAERQKLLMAELQHRTRNVAGVAHALALQILRRSSSLTEFERQFTRQMNALGRVQNLISATDYGNVEVGALVRDELYALHEEQLQSSGRVLLEGPTVLLSASAAQAIGLAIHELATNAVKYGALGQDNGQLRVEWRMEDRKRSPWLVLSWKESGLTLSAENPVRTGYGRELIERALPYQLGAETHFALEPDGVRCRICVRLQDERPA